MKKGYRNGIADVRDVRVGHKTVAVDNVQTGATVILPTEDDIFREELTASCHVINSFGKIGGLIQLEEFGVPGSLIALTDTLYMETAQQALVRCTLQDYPEIGTTSGTASVVVGECNNGYLNGIRVCSIQESDVHEAVVDTGKDFALGAVGTSRSMSCFGMEGGIDSVLKVLELNGERYTVGLLVLSNFGLKNGYIKEDVPSHDPVKEQMEQDSIIIILAADIPMFDRQLKCACKRTPVVLVRLGSHSGDGSGDIAIAFSIANKIPHSVDYSSISQTILYEQQTNKVFHTSIEVCEEVIQSSLDAAETVVRREGHCRYSLKDATAEMRKG